MNEWLLELLIEIQSIIKDHLVPLFYPDSTVVCHRLNPYCIDKETSTVLGLEC